MKAVVRSKVATPKDMSRTVRSKSAFLWWSLAIGSAGVMDFSLVFGAGSMSTLLAAEDALDETVNVAMARGFKALFMSSGPPASPSTVTADVALFCFSNAANHTNC